ncbi:MAG: hypothetical protein ACLGHP_00380, partial [Vicinamibacteria bacterium]
MHERREAFAERDGLVARQQRQHLAPRGDYLLVIEQRHLREGVHAELHAPLDDGRFRRGAP